MEESYIQLHEKHSKEHGATMSPAKIGYLDLALKSGEDKMTESLGKNAVSFVDGRATSRKNALSIKGQQVSNSLWQSHSFALPPHFTKWHGWFHCYFSASKLRRITLL